MTKKRKRVFILIVVSIAAALVCWLVYHLFFSGIKLDAVYYECSNYNDFDEMKEDFERISDIAQQSGEGSYTMIIGLQKYEENNMSREITLNEEDKRRIERIRDYSIKETGKWELSDLSVSDEYVWFWYRNIGCGIIRTSDIKQVVDKQRQFGEKYGYRKLAKNWYAMYV